MSTNFKRVLTSIEKSWGSRNAIVDPSRIFLASLGRICKTANYHVTISPVVFDSWHTAKMAYLEVIKSISVGVDMGDFYRKTFSKVPSITDLLNYLVEVRGVKGVVVFIKLETVVPELLKDCLDLCLVEKHLHVILYGSNDAVVGSILKYPQVRSAFNPILYGSF